MSYYAIVLSDCKGWNDGRAEEAEDLLNSLNAEGLTSGVHAGDVRTPAEHAAWQSWRLLPFPLHCTAAFRLRLIHALRQEILRRRLQTTVVSQVIAILVS